MHVTSYDELLQAAQEKEAERANEERLRWQENGLRVWRRERRKAIIHAVIDYAIIVGVVTLAVVCVGYVISH